MALRNLAVPEDVSPAAVARFLTLNKSPAKRASGLDSTDHIGICTSWTTRSTARSRALRTRHCSAPYFSRPSKVFEDLVAHGGLNMSLLARASTGRSSGSDGTRASPNSTMKWDA